MVLPIQTLPCLVLSRKAIMLHLIIQFLFNHLSTGRLRQVKNKRKFQIFSSKVVAVTYDRWLLTKGFEYNDLTLKILENWSLRRGFSSLTRDGCNQRLECMKKKT